MAILSLARFHKYHILIGPAVFLLCLHFANDEARPWRTAAVLALGTAIAGLFRLDFGAYCALASIVLLLLKYSSDGTRQTSVSLLVFVGTGFILTSPWLALLVLSGDPVEIIERVFQITWGAYTGLSLPLPPYDFSRSPLAPGNGHFLLFWTFRLVPIIVAAILVLGYLGRRVRVRRDNADIKPPP